MKLLRFLLLLPFSTANALDDETIHRKLDYSLTIRREDHIASMNSGVRKTREDETCVTMDVVFKGDVDTAVAKDALENLGCTSVHCLEHLCSSCCLISMLDSIISLDIVHDAYENQPPADSVSLGRDEIDGVFHEASKDNGSDSPFGGESDQGMLSDRAREAFGVDGSGVVIGVISDSFDISGQGSYQDDIECGALPDDVLVLADAPSSLAEYKGDEGRAMLQLVHKIAPEAKLVFHTDHPYGLVGLTKAVKALSKVCDIVVDDLKAPFADSPFQENMWSEAIDSHFASGGPESKGGLYLAAAGNNGRNAWQGKFHHSPKNSPGFTVNGSGEIVNYFKPSFAHNQWTTKQEIIFPVETHGILMVYWDEPWNSVSPNKGSTTDINIYLYMDPDAAEPYLGNREVNIGKRAVTSYQLDLAEPTTLFLEIAIVPYPGFHYPERLQVYFFGSSRPPYDVKFLPFTLSGTSFGHNNAKGAMSIAAAPYWQTLGYNVTPPIMETFTSGGGNPTLFDQQGDRFEQPEYRFNPWVMGPQGDKTTFFGIPLSSDQNHFFGTSASSPNVAVLLL